MLNLHGISLLHAGVFIVRRVTLRVQKGQIVGLVGASGAGKSLLSLAILGLLPRAITCRGVIEWNGRTISGARDEELTSIRGTQIGMVFQNTSSAFDPLIPVGEQLADLFRRHKGLSHQEARAKALAVLRTVEWPDEINPFDRYPHEMSGGQRQRALIAMGIALDPHLIIADEPTASLDVTTGKAILDLLKRLATERGAGLLVISHDLPALATIVDEIAFLQSGMVDKTYPVNALYDAQSAPELAALYARSMPERRPDITLPDPALPPTITVKNLRVTHKKPRMPVYAKRERVEALRGISFDVKPRECVALVGESGSGKSTLARALLGIDRIGSGEIRVSGLDPHRRKTQRALWQKIRLVFQDPIAAIDPNWTVRRIVAEPLALLDGRLKEADRAALVAFALQNVGLPTPLFDRYPHQLSGGQLQRVTLARALVTRPDILVLDEPISALDAEARGQILALLTKLAAESHVSIVLITHDLGVARAVAHRVIVLKDGEIVEEGETLSLLNHPKADYTKALLAASPVMNAARLRDARLAATFAITPDETPDETLAADGSQG